MARNDLTFVYFLGLAWIIRRGIIDPSQPLYWNGQQLGGGGSGGSVSSVNGQQGDVIITAP